VALRKELLLAEDSRFAIRSVSYLGSDRFIMATPGTGTPAGPGFVFEGVNEALNLEGTLAGLDRVLSQLDITAMTEEMRSTVAELMTALRRAMPSLDSGLAGTVRELDRIADGVDSLHAMLATPSTARKLLTSDELYTELRRTNTELQALLADIREHPERYFSLRLR
jgi:hypothetical protein